MVDRDHEQADGFPGGILRTLREEKGLTREWVSAHSDLGLRQVSAIELGEKNPSVDSLRRLIRCMGVSADRIFYPELTEMDTQMSDMMRLLATCSPKQRQLILAFIRMLKEQDLLAFE